MSSLTESKTIKTLNHIITRERHSITSGNTASGECEKRSNDFFPRKLLLILGWGRNSLMTIQTLKCPGATQQHTKLQEPIKQKQAKIRSKRRQPEVVLFSLQITGGWELWDLWQAIYNGTTNHPSKIKCFTSADPHHNISNQPHWHHLRCASVSSF